MISDRAKGILSEGAFENGEQTAIFLEEAGESSRFQAVSGQRPRRRSGAASHPVAGPGHGPVPKPSRGTEDRGDSVQRRDERDGHSIRQEAGGQGMA